MRTLLRSCIFLLLLNIGFLKAQTSDTIRLCQWNLQTYSAQESEERNVNIIKVLKEVNPDVFVLQGILKDSTQQLLHKVVDKLSSIVEYSRVPQKILANFPEYRESHIYFNSKKFKWLESTSFVANRHENLLCRLYHQTTGDTFNIFAVDLHLRSAVDREMLISDITGPLRNQYVHFFKTAVIGGMYFYSPEELGYYRLTARHNSPPFLELIDPFGKEWNENAAEFNHMYTNSTRSNGTRCDTALGNGLKYRYDYILNRRELLENYIPNSYTIFGNDGLDRRNSSITDPPNQIVSQEIAEALQCASSHLPVYADYVFGKVTSVENLPVSELSFHFYPNPLKESSTISCSLPADGVLKITLHDMLGREVAILQDAFKSAGSYTFPFKNENLPNGMYVLKMIAGGRSLTRSVSVVR